MSLKWECSSQRLTILLAFYFTFILNLNLFIHVFELKSTTNLIILTLPLFLFGWFYLLFNFLSIKRIEKPIFIFLIILSSILSYAYGYYGLVFNNYSSMVETIVQTNWIEIAPLITPSFTAWFALSALVPSFLIIKANILRKTLIDELKTKALAVLIYPVLYLLIFLPCFPFYQPIFHLSGLSARPPFQIIPNNFLENFFNYAAETRAAQLPYQRLGLDASLSQDNSVGKKKLIVIVVGEAARSMNLHLNGYARQTTPFSEKQKFISFEEFYACGTSTHTSIPCMFSNLTQKQFSNPKAAHQDNLLDILKRAGMAVYWIDNNGAGDCQGVCAHIPLTKVYGYDEILVTELKKILAKVKDKDSVVILHLQGSHGPNYYAKYPQRFQKFLPECKKNELRACKKETLVNAYDNSILYTDYVLSQLARFLKKQQNWNSVLIYTADHGESIGEKRLYGHCAPYLWAPIEQRKVPFLAWFSPSFQQTNPLSTACIRKAVKHPASHDYMFHTVLGLSGVSTQIYNSSLDLFSDCRKI